MSRFSYILKKIKSADFNYNPFKHIYIENFFSAEDFNAIQNCPEISISKQTSDDDLISELYNHGYNIIEFPGCVTNVKEYIKWHRNKNKTDRTHSACGSFGMVFRLYEKKSKILIDLNEFFLSDEFNRVIADRFAIDLNLCKIDGGIQKYLDGYEISPHPDIRRKASTYMVNINPKNISNKEDHHTHYLRLKDSKKYVSEFWKNNLKYDRDWLPWDWCETIKQQAKNNSIVIFSPSNDTIHGVKANYNHLKAQRTQIYGNIWYLQQESSPLKWEQLQIPSNQRIPFNLSKNIDDRIPMRLKSIIKKIFKRNINKAGKTNMN